MKKTKEHLSYMLYALSIGLFVSVLWAVPVVAAQCDYYASPTGGGDGLSPSTPFRVSDFWAVAAPGKTLCLLDGEYTGGNSMIIPGRLKGTSGMPITIRALNDGGATINGQNINNTVYLRGNDYFTIEGINAHNSISSVFDVGISNNVIIRRACGWDAADLNTNIFSVLGRSAYSLFEDCAGWGICRKVYQLFGGADYVTLRRCWGRWEGSHVVGPKETYTLAYNNRHALFENCIGTWSGERMKETYYLGDYYGGYWLVNGKPVKYNNYEVAQPYAIFGMDEITDDYSMDKNLNSSMLGCLAYTLPTDRFNSANVMMFLTKVDSVNLADLVAVRPQDGTVKPFYFSSLNGGHATNLHASRLTSIGGNNDDYFDPDWVKTNVVHAASIAALGSSPYDGSQGANLCYRYVNGVLTNKPLWPWPMNERIKNAMIQSGRTPVDVTQTVESLLGPISVKCISPATPPSQPNTPLNLRVH